jgi:hypothetical protein
MSRPTSIGIRTMRANIVWGELTANPGVETFEEIAELPRLAGWTARILQTALDDLARAGLLRLDDEEAA